MDSTCRKYRLDTIREVRFWLHAIRASHNKYIITAPPSKRVLGAVDKKHWDKLPQRERNAFMDSLRTVWDFAPKTVFQFTTGKRECYPVHKMFKEIDQGVRIFTREKTDPWYAQAILLIESPAGLAYSPVGAYGPFQLMPDVARQYGLRVGGKHDDRASFDRSAVAAARLLRETMIPQAIDILESYNIPYEEDELWFRLFVMHCYHAGPGNVAAAMRKINTSYGGFSIIRQLWHTRAGDFGPNSQQYSQIALAALIEFDMIVETYWTFAPAQAAAKKM